MNLLNPYRLLGVSINSTMKELRKSYYNLSLLCHPDKGGNASDMDTVHKAYLYIKKQLANNDKCITYEEAEQQFETFCKKQKEQPPPFSKIYEEANDFIRDFNREFEKVHNATHNPFNEGYGHLMEQSELLDCNYSDICDNYIESLTIPIKHTFSQEITIYTEPMSLPNTYGSHYNFDIKKINDFSDHSNIQCTDYIKAFSLSTECEYVSRKNYTSLDELIEERNKLI
tara:strand:- start:675 stop:1358 length:684 start_codon:yes stop_codon:yes gene_type:complete